MEEKGEEKAREAKEGDRVEDSDKQRRKNSCEVLIVGSD